MRIEGNDQRLAAAAATQMQQTGVQQMLAPKKNSQQQAAQRIDSENTVQSIVSDKVSIKIELPQKTVDTLQNMGNISDFLNSVAANLRQTNEGLKAASSIVNDMKTSLDNIIKSYPPYSVDSEERINELMQYSSLRKQLLSLMVPAPPPPIYEKVQHLWDDLFNGPASTLQTPALPQGAPDSHVSAANKQLDVVAEQISLVQDTMLNSIVMA